MLGFLRHLPKIFFSCNVVVVLTSSVDSVSTAFWYLTDITWSYRPHIHLPARHLHLDVPQEFQYQHVIFIHFPLSCYSTSVPSSVYIPTLVPQLQIAVSDLWSSLSHPVTNRAFINKSRGRGRELLLCLFGNLACVSVISFWSHCISWLLHLPKSTANVPDTLGAASIWVQAYLLHPSVSSKISIYTQYKAVTEMLCGQQRKR